MFKYLIATLAMALGLSGCLVQTACTDIAVSSTSLTVENELGELVSGATVTFRAADLSDEPCQELGEPGVYTCGFEVAGEMTISIQAEGFEPAEVTVDVDSDSCHVITEDVAVTLTTAAEPA